MWGGTVWEWEAAALYGRLPPGGVLLAALALILGVVILAAS